MSNAASMSPSRQGWLRARAPMIRWLVLFLLLLGAGLAIIESGWFVRTVFPTILRANAQAAGAVAGLLGKPVTVTENRILTDHGALEVVRGCDALEPMIIVVAAMSVFPTSWRRRGVGIAIGLLALQAFNVVRVVSLIYAADHSRSLFETLHVDVFQPLFILLAIAIVFGWMRRVTVGAVCTARATPRVPSSDLEARA